MKAYRATFPLAAMCRVLGLSPSGYYDWLKRPPSARTRRDVELQGKILLIWGGSRETYGCPRIQAELQAAGERVSRKRVARLMKDLGIQGVTRRRFKTATTKKDAKARPAPDLVNRNFSAGGPDQLWVADINDVRLAEAAREVARRRRARDHLRPQGVHVGRVVAQGAQVLQPRASAQHVVRDVQHVVRLVVRKIPLQQRQPPVDLPGQPQLRHQPPDHADAPVAHRVDPRPDLVAHPAGPEHRLRPRAPPPPPRMPCLHLPPPPGTVPSALFVRYCLHRKGLLVEIRRLAPISC